MLDAAGPIEFVKTLGAEGRKLVAIVTILSGVVEAGIIDLVKTLDGEEGEVMTVTTVSEN